MMTDTLMLKSPTTTDVDRAVAAKLGEQVGVDPVKFGMEVFLTRPSGSFTAAEMVGQRPSRCSSPPARSCSSASTRLSTRPAHSA